VTTFNFMQEQCSVRAFFTPQTNFICSFTKVVKKSKTQTKVYPIVRSAFVD